MVVIVYGIRIKFKDYKDNKCYKKRALKLILPFRYYVIQIIGIVKKSNVRSNPIHQTISIVTAHLLKYKKYIQSINSLLIIDEILKKKRQFIIILHFNSSELNEKRQHF